MGWLTTPDRAEISMGANAPFLFRRRVTGRHATIYGYISTLHKQFNESLFILTIDKCPKLWYNMYVR